MHISQEMTTLPTLSYLSLRHSDTTIFSSSTCAERRQSQDKKEQRFAISKGMWAVKLSTNKILQFLTGGAG